MMMQALQVPGRMPQGAGAQESNLLAAIFSALPEGTMMKALSSVGVNVGAPQSGNNLAPDDGSNDVPSWNDRRVVLRGNDNRGPVWDRSKVMQMQMQTPMARGEEPPYMAGDYDPNIGAYGMANNAGGGF